MLSYFIQHTKTLGIRDENLRKLWDQEKVAIHFPGNLEGADLKSLNPEDYEGSPGARTAKASIKCFKELIRDGGYVWGAEPYL